MFITFSTCSGNIMHAYANTGESAKDVIAGHVGGSQTVYGLNAARLSVSTISNIQRNNINRPLLSGLRHPQKLFVTLPQIHKKADGCKPERFRAHPHLNSAVIIEPGKRLRVAYPAFTFFGSEPSSGSLSIFRAVPLNIASVMDAL